MSDTRVLFDAVIEKYSNTTNRLTSSAGIVLCPNFESAIGKIQRKNASVLSREETMSVSTLLLQEITPDIIVEEGLSFALQALYNETVDKYTDTRFLLPTSNICERLFSKFGMTLSDMRKELTGLIWNHNYFSISIETCGIATTLTT